MGIRLEDLPEGARRQAEAQMARGEATRIERERGPNWDRFCEEPEDAPAVPGTGRDPRDPGTLDMFAPPPRSPSLFDRPPKPSASSVRAKNAAKGAKSKRQGASFESDVQKAVDQMRSLGIADLSRNRPGFRPEYGPPDPKTGKRVVVGGRHIAKGTVDFEGCVRGGRFVRVELKTVDGSRLNFASSVSDGERAALDRAVDFGALSFLLVRFLSCAGDAFLYPWKDVRGAKSVVPESGRVAKYLFLEDFARGRTP